MNEEESKQIFKDFFGSSFQTGLIQIYQAEQFKRCTQALIDKWKHRSKKQVTFAEQFETYKKEQYKYHVSKNAVWQDWQDWQERKKLDCVRFTEEFEDLISQQHSDILSHAHIIQKEYLHLAIKFNIDFSNKTVEEKAEIFFYFLNVVVDEKCYRSILNYTPGKQAIKEL